MHEETERLIERANRAIAQSLFLIEENRSSINQAWARLRFLQDGRDEAEARPDSYSKPAWSSSIQIKRSQGLQRKSRTEPLPGLFVGSVSFNASGTYAPHP